MNELKKTIAKIGLDLGIIKGQISAIVSAISEVMPPSIQNDLRDIIAAGEAAEKHFEETVN